jgi:hypothetical protein
MKFALESFRAGGIRSDEHKSIFPTFLDTTTEVFLTARVLNLVGQFRTRRVHKSARLVQSGRSYTIGFGKRRLVSIS